MLGFQYRGTDEPEEQQQPPLSFPFTKMSSKTFNDPQSNSEHYIYALKTLLKREGKIET